MTAAPVVQRAGFKSGRISWDWLETTTRRRAVPAAPTLEELAAMPPWFARAVFGLAVIPLPILRHAEAVPRARQPEPRWARTALGSGIVKPLVANDEAPRCRRCGAGDRLVHGA
ncbi:hypothetical protein WME88_27415 [Sorangium sp. So ce216]